MDKHRHKRKTRKLKKLILKELKKIYETENVKIEVIITDKKLCSFEIEPVQEIHIFYEADNRDDLMLEFKFTSEKLVGFTTEITNRLEVIKLGRKIRKFVYWNFR